MRDTLGQRGCGISRTSIRGCSKWKQVIGQGQYESPSEGALDPEGGKLQK